MVHLYGIMVYNVPIAKEGMRTMFTYTNNEQLVIELKKLMLDEKITQQQIADALGISRQGVQGILTKKNFSFQDVQKILGVMNHSLEINFRKND